MRKVVCDTLARIDDPNRYGLFSDAGLRLISRDHLTSCHGVPRCWLSLASRARVRGVVFRPGAQQLAGRAVEGPPRAASMTLASFRQ